MGAFTVCAIPHPSRVVHRAGFDLGSSYVERCWTPVLGCTAVMLLRRLAVEMDDAERFSIDEDGLAAALGLIPSRLAHTVNRLVQFGFAEWRDGELCVPTTVPPLSNGQLPRLPQGVRADHALLLGDWLDRLAATA